MASLSYTWQEGEATNTLEFVHVPGTEGTPFLFGGQPNRRPIEVRGFYIGATPVTQAFWLHVMGSNPAERKDLCSPVENISWEHVTGPGGFLERINQSHVRESLAASDHRLRFRLPSETEWEYAARGGPHWTDELTYSGSHRAGDVAWYGSRWSPAHRLGTRLLGRRFGWRVFGRQRFRRQTRTHAVAGKAPNQLGIYDMSGNVWEWCQDVCTADLGEVPADGAPWLGPGDERRLRGGCHHNWDIHCTVSFRYGIAPDSHDGCIGFRLVLATF
jgi:formylglycine-generating enzyme required for sulfatase activity